MFAREFDEFACSKTVVAHFDGVPDFAIPDALRQQREKAGEILAIEFLGRCELPIDRTELVAELEHAAGEEAGYRVAGFGQQASIGGEARPLHREDEVVGRLLPPLHEAFGLLGPVIGAVDLDRRELAARIFELALLRQPLRIEDAAPWLESPAADADANFTDRLCGHGEGNTFITACFRACRCYPIQSSGTSSAAASFSIVASDPLRRPVSRSERKPSPISTLAARSACE